MYEPYGPIRRPENINPAELPTSNAERGLLAAELGRQIIELVSSETISTKKSALDDLTAKEAEILRLLASGLSNTKIAKELWIAEQTVKFHLSNVYAKLGVTNRTEAANVFLNQEGGNSGITLEVLQDKERKIREAAALLVRGGAILASVIDGPIDVDTHTSTENNLIHMTPLRVISDAPTTDQAEERRNNPMAPSDKLISIIEQHLNEPWDIEARTVFGETLYGANDGRTKVQRKNVLTLLIRSAAVQRGLKSRGISLSVSRAREYFKDISRDANELVFIFEKALSEDVG